jgi:spermidine/putrescine transport system permease protein
VAVEAQSLPRRRQRSWGRRGREWATTATLLGVPVAWLAVFFLIPVGFVAAYSVGLFALFPGDAGFSWSAWQDFFHGSIYLNTLFPKSVLMSLGVSAICVVLAYPVAYFLALCSGKRKYVLLLVILAPFLTSFLLRVLAWKVILGDQGVINSFAYWTGIRANEHPIPALLYSRFTVMLVLTYVWVPFVALPIFVALENLDRRLLEAASDLGASRWQAFRRVTFPLSLPGVGAAFVFVFIPTIGEYVTPLLVGGNKGFMFGNAIADLFGPGFDWKTGSVLALFLFGVVLALMALFARFLSVRRVTAT